MCGIVGAVSIRNIVPVLLDGLHRLEYRGYDSAGVAVINTINVIERVRRSGKVQVLSDGVTDCDLKGNIGIAHTRWATHGAPSEKNAHPHMIGDRIVLVHNGIIENYMALRKTLPPELALTSDTDSEIIAALIWLEITQKNQTLLAAVQEVVKILEGAYAIAVLDAMDPNSIIVARCGSPVAIGLGSSANYIASDPLALHRVAQEFIFLEEHDVAAISVDNIKIYDVNGELVSRNIHSKPMHVEAADKGQYRHFMQKEIFAQPEAISSTISGRIHQGRVLEQAFGLQAEEIFNHTKSVTLIACGTSYYAGLIARYWLESIAGIPCNVEVASEYRYRKRVVTPGTLLVAISQSGETADTLAALMDSKNTNPEAYSGTLAICNVAESTLVRNVDLTLLTHAGPEICVASTKGFMTQLVGLFLLTLALGRRSKLSSDEEAELVAQLMHLPQVISEFLTLDKQIKKIAQFFAHKTNALFLGRGILYPIALEGALKLKELSYIHAEAYPAGELKHGPLALVDQDMPVIVLAPNDSLLAKLKSNIQEVDTRGGKLIVITTKSAQIAPTENITVLEVPETLNTFSAMTYVVPMQLLAYHVAVFKGTDVDQPRNLAKSVTVE
jgi:glucosamine--fructose-6-phosphate aminotransferase (isomerizing)